MPWRSRGALVGLVLAAACSNQAYKEDADAQVYDILETATEAVLGQAKVVPVERPVDTLRRRLENSAVEGPVQLTLLDALDVAAENSREFQRQKESLYTAALDLTREAHDFAVRFGAGGSADISGVGDDDTNVDFSPDLSAAVNTMSGGRIVASFGSNFLRSIVSGEGWGSSSFLNLTFTQPLLAGLNPAVVREPLTQAERDVVYAVRDYERFRAELAVDVVSSYLSVASQVEDLVNEDNNRKSRIRIREQIEKLQEAERRTVVDLGRARQDELTAEDRFNNARARLQSSLDSFKFLLGLPTDARMELVPGELEKLRNIGVFEPEISDADAIRIALSRRWDHRNVKDSVADAARRVVVAEDALNSIFDFSAAMTVPTEDDQPLKFDWSEVRWAAGFDLDLAIDRLPQRNSYRRALINVDVAIRNREASEDRVKSQIRQALRNLRRTYRSYQIQTDAVRLAEDRVRSSQLLYDAGRTDILAVLDSQDSLLASQLSLTRALVDYAIARLELLRDMEGLAMEPSGLRYDSALLIPEEAATEPSETPEPPR